MRLTAAAAVLIPFCWCFGEALTSSRSFAHRDASRFYRSLFYWIQQEWESGRVPLWNPQENGGNPVVGDTTSSVFYPGKLLFFAPLDFGLRYKLYVVGHVLLAAGSTFYAARRWSAGTAAAALAGMSYAFGGYVLFQHTNVVFLVGAAWLPICLLAAERMLRRRSVKWAIAFGTALGLMTLGGDPHTAYHAGLLAVMYGWMLRRRHRRRRRLRSIVSSASPSAHRRPAFRRWSRNRFVLLATAACCGAVLAAVQILPSLKWSAKSTRAVVDDPRSLYAISTVLAEDEDLKLFRREKSSPWTRIRSGIFESPPEGTPQRTTYRYSIEPFRLTELVFPNAGGKTFPLNRRLLTARLEDVDPWVPSLYCGLLPLVLAFGAFRFRTGSVRRRWLTWGVILAVVGSFGWYGPGWILQAMDWSPRNASGEPALGEPVGGLYWMMVTLLPGYEQFRYPAKLFVVASLGLSLLAACGWDRMCFDSRRTRAALGRLTVLAAALMMAAVLLRRPITEWLAASPADDSFGPPDVDGALAVLYASIGQTMLVGAILWWLCRGIGGARGRYFQAAALGLSAIELAAAQGWMVALSTDHFWAPAPWAAEQIADSGRQTRAPFRVHRSRSVYLEPEDWQATSSPLRQSELLEWHRQTLFPRTHLLTDVTLLEAETSLVPFDFRTTTIVSRTFGPRAPGDVSQLHPVLIDAMGVRYLLQPDQEDIAARQRLFGRQRVATLEGRNAALWYNPDHFDRAWIVHSVERIPKPLTGDPAVIESVTLHAYFPKGRARDLRIDAMVEIDPTEELTRMADSSRAPSGGEACRIVRYEPQYVEIHADLTRPGLVILSDYYDADWQAVVTDRETGQSHAVDVLRTNRIMRGIYLPRGRYAIAYRYRPRAFHIGAVVSGCGWFLLLCVAAGKPARGVWPRRRPKLR